MNLLLGSGTVGYIITEGTSEPNVRYNQIRYNEMIKYHMNSCHIQ